ncbi:MAG TPA: hypothetical protein DCP90_02590, partial [Clostridiales bacterium]|nr:hypothetical protein [Clostridiales bacterium]
MAKETDENEKPVKVIRFDWAIKHILRNKANFDVLEGFLSALLKEDMQVIEILESESNKNSAEHKFNRVDLLVKDKSGRKIIIEVQNASETDFMERLIWGASTVISESIGEGRKYKDIAKVISISIVYFHVIQGNDYIYKAYTDIKPEYYGDFEFARENEVISWYGKENKFPEYYILDLTTYKDEVKSDIDEWVYMLKNSEVRPEFKSKNIDKAREKLNKLKMTIAERNEYRSYMMDQVVLKDNIETAIREGHEQGLEEGIEKGIE